jgi:CRP-like cAMP-binding protein
MSPSTLNLTHVAGHMAQSQHYEALQANAFTRNLAEAHLARLVTLVEPVHFREDQIIFGSGERSPYLYLLTSGCVCLEIRTPVYAVCVQAVGPNEAFGWSSLVDQSYTAFQVRARESSHALRLRADEVMAACREDPAFGFAIYRRLAALIAKRLWATESRLGEFCGVSPAKTAHLVPCPSA